MKSIQWICLIPKTNAGYALNPRAGKETKFHPDEQNSGRNLNAGTLCLWYPQSYDSHSITEWRCKLWTTDANEVTD